MQFVHLEVSHVAQCPPELPNQLHPAIQDPVTRRETLVWIRSEIEHSRHITDVVRSLSFSCTTYLSEEALQTLIEDKLKLGRRDLKAILPTVQ